jgi:hypothetical protein
MTLSIFMSTSRLALLTCLVLTSACIGTDGDRVEATYPSIDTAKFGEINNVSKMGSIWFGAMPCVEDLDLAFRRGVKRVVDLSIASEKSEFSMAAACARLDIELLVAGMPIEGAPSDESVDLVLGWLAESYGLPCEAGEATAIPTLMIDGSGGRCATFLAIFRAVHLDVPLGVALEEARRGGMIPGLPEEFVRTQVERLSTSG